jgi:hypothetical protein
LEDTDAKVREHFGLGPLMYWSKVSAVSESQVRVPSEMLAIAESKVTKAEDYASPNGQDVLPGLSDSGGIVMEKVAGTGL